jgi:predicted dehydrogenase
VATLALAIESEDTATVTVHFASGAVGILTASVATHDAATQIDVIGEHAGVHLPWRITASDERVRRQLLTEALAAVPAPGRLASPEVVRVRNKLGKLSARLAPPAAAPLHLGYWTAVADALDAGAPLPIGPVEARRSVELVTAIYTSALEDRTVDLPLAADCRFAGGVTRVDDAGRAVTAATP